MSLPVSILNLQCMDVQFWNNHVAANHKHNIGYNWWLKALQAWKIQLINNVKKFAKVNLEFTSN